MLDLKLIRADPDGVRAALARRGAAEADRRAAGARRALARADHALEELQAEQNAVGKQSARRSAAGDGRDRRRWSARERPEGRARGRWRTRCARRRTHECSGCWSRCRTCPTESAPAQEDEVLREVGAGGQAPGATTSSCSATTSTWRRGAQRVGLALRLPEGRRSCCSSSRSCAGRSSCSAGTASTR